jgi:hypothetical protein
MASRSGQRCANSSIKAGMVLAVGICMMALPWLLGQVGSAILAASMASRTGDHNRYGDNMLQAKA